MAAREPKGPRRMVLGRRLAGSPTVPQHPPRICSFCDAQETPTRIVFSGKGGVYICADCVNLCREVLVADASVRV